MTTTNDNQHEARRVFVLTYIEQHGDWPVGAVASEKEELIAGGFVDEDRYPVLTSLGELEIGHEETVAPKPTTEPQHSADVPVNDPAAVFGIALSLHEAARANKGDISGTFNGADQYMRECMRVGVLFEAWANANVDFEQLDDVWPYLLEDKFGNAVVAEYGSVLLLASFGETECRAIAARLNLTFKAAT